MSHVSLQDFLRTEPDGTLEAIAAQYNTTLLDVVKNLPSHTLVSGDNSIPSGTPSANGAKSQPWCTPPMSFSNLPVNCPPASIVTVISICAVKKA